jgi:hypothetical protein
MGKPEIKLGDKIFLYGQFMKLLCDFNEYEYNTVMGYMTIGGYVVYPVESISAAASIPGFVVDVPLTPSLAPAAPFIGMEMEDVTDRLSLQSPFLTGTRVWMPTTQPILVGS